MYKILNAYKYFRILLHFGNHTIRTVTSLRDISEKTWIYSYPINGGKFRILKESENDGYLQLCVFGR